MRRLLLSALAGLLIVAPTFSQAMTVGLNETAKVRLGAPARNVVVADPAVADVSLIGPQDLLIIGRGYGAADVVVTDAYGRTLFSEQVTVQSPDTGQVSLFRGAQASTFACAPRCEPVQLSADARQ